VLPILLGLHKGVERGDALEALGETPNAGDTSDWKIDSSGLCVTGVPPDSTVQGEIMKICYDDIVAGHYG
jgi:hypothetical protein